MTGLLHENTKSNEAEKSGDSQAVKKMLSFVFLTRDPCLSSDKNETENESKGLNLHDTSHLGIFFCFNPTGQNEITRRRTYLNRPRKMITAFFSSTVLSKIFSSVISLHLNSHKKKNTFCKPVAKNGFAFIVYHIAIC